MKPLHISSCGRDTPGPSPFSAGGHRRRRPPRPRARRGPRGRWGLPQTHPLPVPVRAVGRRVISFI